MNNRPPPSGPVPLGKGFIEEYVERFSKMFRRARGPVNAWLRQPTSLRKSINANCEDCVGSENMVNAIRNCKVYSCKFWYVRPYQNKSGDED